MVIDNIYDVNRYIATKQIGLTFTNLKEFVDAYLSARETNKHLNIAYCKTLWQVRQDIEKDWIAGLEKNCYTLEQIEKMTLIDIAELIRQGE